MNTNIIKQLNTAGIKTVIKFSGYEDVGWMVATDAMHKDGIFLSSVTGYGKTVEQAVLDFNNVIKGKVLVYDVSTEERIQIVIAGGNNEYSMPKS